MTLQNQALEIIKDLDLLAITNKYGEAYLVGNVALNTTVKPDIDIQIYAPQNSWEKSTDEIIDYFKSLGLTDYTKRELTKSHKYLLSFRINRFEQDWSIDITFTEKGDLPYLQDAYKFYLDYKDRLTEEKCELVRRFKQVYLEENKLRNSIAYYIYIGVLEKGITKIEDMRKYIDETKDER